MKSPLKWVGGKDWLSGHLVNKWRHNKSVYYYEPFCGGFAVGLEVLRSGLKEWVIASDQNSDLINFWNSLRIAPYALISEARRLEAAHLRDPDKTFVETKAHYNETSSDYDPYTRAAEFLYLSKAGFNGLYRVNRSGKYNVSRGTLVSGFLDEDYLRFVSNLISDSVFRVSTYHDIDVPKGSLVYSDPPYVPASKTACFTGYVVGGFDHARFAKWCGEIDSEVWVSNSATDMARDLFGSWASEEVSRSGTMNSDPTKRGKVKELLFHKNS